MTITSSSVTARPEEQEKNETLPAYIIFDGKEGDKSIVRQKTKEMSFPLSDEDKNDIAILEAKFDQEENCAGLAAPQIGISKRFIIFKVSDAPELKKWRPDLTQTLSKTIWLNPSYEPLDDKMHGDYEACFSILDMAGPVKRYKRIKYTAYDINGNLLQGIAEGFLARVIQHEIDHLNGKLYIDYVAKEDLLTIEEYRERRQKAMEAMQEE